jgi:hypothetical protein
MEHLMSIQRSTSTRIFIGIALVTLSAYLVLGTFTTEPVGAQMPKLNSVPLQRVAKKRLQKRAPVHPVYATRLLHATPTIKAKMTALQQRSRKERWRFTPVYTSALDRSIKQLTGAGPGPSREIALNQQSLSKEILAYYENERQRLNLPKFTLACNTLATFTGAAAAK